MKLVHLLLQNSGKDFSLAVLASLISGVSSAGMIAVVNYGISHVSNLPWWLLWVFVGLGILLWIFRFVSWILITGLSQSVIYNLRIELTERILNCPLQRLEKLGNARLLAALTGDINALGGASIQLSVLLVNFAVLLGVFAYLFWLSPILFAIVIASLVAGYGIYCTIQQRGNKFLHQARNVQDNLFQNFRSITEGTKELKLHRPRRNAFLNEDIKPTAQDAKLYWVKAITSFALAGSTGTALFFIPVGLILFVFPQMDVVSPATIASYALAVLYVINPISEIVATLPQLAQANVALEKIDTLGFSLTEFVTEPRFPTGSNFAPDWSSLELVNLNHTYPGDDETHPFNLSEINLEFKPGEIVLIIGGNGSGKSTLVKLITGLYQPEQGQIYFNRQLVIDANREWFRQQFSVIFYDFYLFDRLIGVDFSQEQEIQGYLKLDLLHESNDS